MISNFLFEIIYDSTKKIRTLNILTADTIVSFIEHLPPRIVDILTACRHVAIFWALTNLLRKRIY